MLNSKKYIKRYDQVFKAKAVELSNLKELISRNWPENWRLKKQSSFFPSAFDEIWVYSDRYFKYNIYTKNYI